MSSLDEWPTEAGARDYWRSEQRLHRLRQNVRDEIIARIGWALLGCARLLREVAPAFVAICIAKYFGVI